MGKGIVEAYGVLRSTPYAVASTEDEYGYDGVGTHALLLGNSSSSSSSSTKCYQHERRLLVESAISQ